MEMSVRFWGVRGSVATPGPETAAIGGNTSCVEVQIGTQRLILDAGTDFRGLGNYLVKEKEVDITLLLSHLHWDHIQGIPFFSPLYRSGTRIEVIAGHNSVPLHQILHRQMSAPTFPVDLHDLPADLSYREVRDAQEFEVKGAKVTVCRANHPDPVFAYRIDYQGKSVVYATDTEHYACVDPRLVRLALSCDLLIYDAQYLPEEYVGATGLSRVGWGHSTYEAAAELAQAAEVGELILFHHDPSRGDRAVEALEHRARSRFPRTRAAREGLSIPLSA